MEGRVSEVGLGGRVGNREERMGGSEEMVADKEFGRQGRRVGR